MKLVNRFIRYLTNIEILSALIWALVIIACGKITDNNSISIVLITAAGFHVILLSQFQKRKSQINI